MGYKLTFPSSTIMIARSDAMAPPSECPVKMYLLVGSFNLCLMGAKRSLTAFKKNILTLTVLPMIFQGDPSMSAIVEMISDISCSLLKNLIVTFF